MSEPAASGRATRRELLATGGTLTGAALLGGSAVASAHHRAPPSDGVILSRTLGMAQLAAYTYTAIFASGILKGGRRRALDGFDEQERAHVLALERAVRDAGATIPMAPRTDQEANRRYMPRKIPGRLGQLTGPENALGLLIDVERASIGSCFVALGALSGADPIVLVSRIMANDAQHEAILSLQRHALKLPAAAPYALVSGAH